MKLKILRWFETLFYEIGSWFEDWADGIDINFQETIRRSMNEPVIYKYKCFVCGKIDNLNSYIVCDEHDPFQ